MNGQKLPISRLIENNYFFQTKSGRIFYTENYKKKLIALDRKRFFIGNREF